MSSTRLGLDFNTTNLVIAWIGSDDRCVANQQELSSSSLTLDNLESAIATTLSKLERDRAERTLVTIPEDWYRNPEHPDREKFEHLLSQVSTELGNWTIVSSAIAISAYWLTKQRDYQGNLLICDVAESAFQVHLCCITKDDRVKVIYSDQQQLAGRAFNAYCLETAYLHKHGQSISSAHPEWNLLLRQFEHVKNTSDAFRQGRWEAYLKSPDLLADYNLFCFGGGYAVKCQQAHEAFTVISIHIQQAAQKFKTWLQEQHQSLDQIILTGHSCQFPLVQHAIQQAFELDENDSPWNHCLNAIEQQLASAYGACLIVNQYIEPIETIPCTLGVVCERLNSYAEKEQQFIPLIFAGTPLEQVRTLSQAKNLQISTFILNTVLLWIEYQSQHRVIKLIKLNSRSQTVIHEEDVWQVGLRLNTANILQLVLQGEQSGHEYELGALSEMIS